jgi:hypothetical protein
MANLFSDKIKNFVVEGKNPSNEQNFQINGSTFRLQIKIMFELQRKIVFAVNFVLCSECKCHFALKAYSMFLGDDTGPGWASLSTSGTWVVVVAMTSLEVEPWVEPPPRTIVTYSRLLGVVAWLLV